MTRRNRGCRNAGHGGAPHRSLLCLSIILSPSICFWTRSVWEIWFFFFLQIIKIQQNEICYFCINFDNVGTSMYSIFFSVRPSTNVVHIIIET